METIEEEDAQYAQGEFVDEDTAEPETLQGLLKSVYSALPERQRQEVRALASSAGESVMRIGVSKVGLTLSVLGVLGFGSAVAIKTLKASSKHERS
jgi:hypothetical protein